MDFLFGNKTLNHSECQQVASTGELPAGDQNGGLAWMCVVARHKASFVTQISLDIFFFSFLLQTTPVIQSVERNELPHHSLLFGGF